MNENHFTFSLIIKINKELRRYQQWRYGVSSDVRCSDWLI